jgi:hypothetical protein
VNSRQQWLKEQKARRIEKEIVEAEERAVESRGKAITLGWFGAGISTMSAILGAVAHAKHPAVGLSVSAALWMSALHMSDTMGRRQPPRLLRWAINAFAIASAIYVVAGLFRHTL